MKRLLIQKPDYIKIVGDKKSKIPTELCYNNKLFVTQHMQPQCLNLKAFLKKKYSVKPVKKNYTLRVDLPQYDITS